MNRRKLGWQTLIVWIFTVIYFDSLRDLPGRIARHHADFLAPWAEYFIAGFALVIAIGLTLAWLRSRKLNPSNEQVR